MAGSWEVAVRAELPRTYKSGMGEGAEMGEEAGIGAGAKNGIRFLRAFTRLSKIR